MTTAEHREPPSAAPAGVAAAHAPSIYERWARCVHEARVALGAGADREALLAHASARWREQEAPELAFVPDELRAIAREQRHDTGADTFLDRIARGEAAALRRKADGAIVYLPSDLIDAMTPAERATYDAYDPMLARALRRHALEGELEAADRWRSP